MPLIGGGRRIFTIATVILVYIALLWFWHLVVGSYSLATWIASLFYFCLGAGCFFVLLFFHFVNVDKMRYALAYAALGGLGSLLLGAALSGSRLAFNHGSAEEHVGLEAWCRHYDTRYLSAHTGRTIVLRRMDCGGDVGPYQEVLMFLPLNGSAPEFSNLILRYITTGGGWINPPTTYWRDRSHLLIQIYGTWFDGFEFKRDELGGVKIRYEITPR